MEDRRYLKTMKTSNSMKYSIIFLMLLFTFSFTSAQKLNDNYALTISSNNATACTATYVQYPDGTRNIYNLALTKDGTTFYGTIAAGNFTKIGETCIGLSCTDGVTYETGSKCLDVNPSGFMNTLGFFILILLLSGGVIILGFSIRDAPITILGSLGLYFLSLYILFNGINGIKEPVYTWAIGIIILGLAMYISIRSAYELIVDGEGGFLG